MFKKGKGLKYKICILKCDFAEVNFRDDKKSMFQRYKFEKQKKRLINKKCSIYKNR